MAQGGGPDRTRRQELSDAPLDHLAEVILSAGLSSCAYALFHRDGCLINMGLVGAILQLIKLGTAHLLHSSPRSEAASAIGATFTSPRTPAGKPAERQAVEFGVEIGEYRGVVGVPRRVFRRLLPDFLGWIVGLLSGTDGVGTSPATGSRR